MRPEISPHLDMQRRWCRWRMVAACSAITINPRWPPTFSLWGLGLMLVQQPSIIKSVNKVLKSFSTCRVFTKLVSSHQDVLIRTHSRVESLYQPITSLLELKKRWHRFKKKSDVEGWNYSDETRTNINWEAGCGNYSPKLESNSILLVWRKWEKSWWGALQMRSAGLRLSH